MSATAPVLDVRDLRVEIAERYRSDIARGLGDNVEVIEQPFVGRRRRLAATRVD